MLDWAGSYMVSNINWDNTSPDKYVAWSRLGQKKNGGMLSWMPFDVGRKNIVGNWLNFNRHSMVDTKSVQWHSFITSRVHIQCSNVAAMGNILAKENIWPIEQ